MCGIVLCFGLCAPLNSCNSGAYILPFKRTGYKCLLIVLCMGGSKSSVNVRYRKCCKIMENAVY